MPKTIRDDLEAFIATLPPRIAEPLGHQENASMLLEVVMDLGRPPEARYPGRDVTLDGSEVTPQDIDHVVSRIGDFGGDNRAGIERTLHRISCLRNRKGKVVGLSCRVGRAVLGTVQIINDLVESGSSLLLLGRPGVGKTTMLREVARVLAEMGKRVIIVDTSNEIAGDGDIPHPAIGRARRLQVPTPALQHAVMIEAVENHMPEVIVIDEIGTELEAAAARTIAERGVQLVATAHGNTLDNLILNPTLSDLVGGVQPVTLGDEEARRRHTQKTVLERKAPPTFDVVVEIQSWEKVAVHVNVAETVDSWLRDEVIPPEQRWLDENGELVKVTDVARDKLASGVRGGREGGRNGHPKKLYPFGVSRSRLEDVARSLQIPLDLAADLAEAEAILTSRRYYRRRPQALRHAEAAGVPIYVLSNDSTTQIEEGLANFYGVRRPTELGAMKEAETAIAQVLEQGGEVELSPQSAYVRRMQHLLAEQYKVSSRSLGHEPFRRVHIFKGAGE